LYKVLGQQKSTLKNDHNFELSVINLKFLDILFQHVQHLKNIMISNINLEENLKRGLYRIIFAYFIRLSEILELCWQYNLTELEKNETIQFIKHKVNSYKS
jgi:hypothetical protein